MQVRKEALWACFAMEPNMEAMISVSYIWDVYINFYIVIYMFSR